MTSEALRKILIAGLAILSLLCVSACDGHEGDPSYNAPIEDYLIQQGYKTPTLSESQFTVDKDASICGNYSEELYIFDATNGVGLVCGGNGTAPHILVRKTWVE